MIKPQSVQKKGFLDYLRSLLGKTTKPLKFEVIPYKHQGTTAGEDGIRIMGSREFIESALIRLGVQDILANENTQTRLQVTYSEAMNRKEGTVTGGWVCYIQVRERGNEAKMANAIASSMAGKEVIL